MAESLKIDPELMEIAAGRHRTIAEELQGPLAAHEQLEAARAAHGPIFADFKEALAETLAARRAEILDQIATNQAVAETISEHAARFAATEAANATRQASVSS
jgi:hypothetical protein